MCTKWLFMQLPTDTKGMGARTDWSPSEACLQQGEVDPRGSGGTLNSGWDFCAELLKAPVPIEP